jgi:hypothetical protein
VIVISDMAGFLSLAANQAGKMMSARSGTPDLLAASSDLVILPMYLLEVE